jgi:cell division septation protein DedD
MRSSARPAAALTPALLVLALCLAGCSREADDWRGAQAADTSASYEQFLHQYPRSAHVNEANTRLAQLAEDEAWQGATSIDTQMGYQQFLTRYPDGKWAQEARVRIENFSLTASLTPPVAAPTPPPVAPSAARPVEAPAPVAPPPAPEKPVAAKPPAVKKKAEPASSGDSGFGAQLGAFSSKAKADAAWARLEAQFKDELRGATHRVVPGHAGTGEVYRLRVPQAGAKSARQLCERLKARNEVCVVYRP